MTSEEILEMDFYDLCGSASTFMTDNDKIEWWRNNIKTIEDCTINKRMEDMFVEGYKARALSSELIFDEASELYARELFKELKNKS